MQDTTTVSHGKRMTRINFSRVSLLAPSNPCHLAAFSLSCFLAFCTAEAEPTGKTVQRIALGSCANQNLPQPIWDSVIESRPDLFLFLGDNVYADTTKPEVMRAEYEKLDAIPGYRKLRETCPILAVWDDHDYGQNDAGKEYPMKVEAEKIFHEFFQTPADSGALSRPGIYQTRYFGGDGNRLQVILLDTRYFRDNTVRLAARSPHGPYSENRDPGASVLGDAQWQWLEKQLEEPADFRIIASSIQVLPQDHRWERWENFPLERARLLRLLAKTGSGPVVFVSGDRHMGEIMELKTTDPLSPGFPVYELTSSGLTNAGGGRYTEPNRHRAIPQPFRLQNFGLIVIDWDQATATLELRNVDGTVVASLPMPFPGKDGQQN